MMVEASDNGIAGVLHVPRYELVPDRVPNETLAATVIQLCELEQFPPHPLEALDRPTVFRAVSQHRPLGRTLWQAAS